MSKNIVITSLDILPVRVSGRTLWTFFRLKTNDRYDGVGECSIGNGVTPEKIEPLWALINRSDPDVELFIKNGRPLVKDIFDATVFSAIEMALWDLRGKLNDAPVVELLGEIQNPVIPVYANINRRTTPRDPDGFAKSSKEAISAGFNSVKAAPFDGLSKIENPNKWRQALESGIDCMRAIRRAIGPNAKVKVDCHENFDIETAMDVSTQLEIVDLDWYEEPVLIDDIEAMLHLKENATQKLAGGELGFGVDGFSSLIESRCVDVIMPDVMHCGGIREFVSIAREASLVGISVSAHNACGPVSTAATIQAAAAASGCESVELQWGEVDWREKLIVPEEAFHNGFVHVPRSPGLGIELNDFEISSRLDS